VQVNGVNTTEFSAANQCFNNRNQNGDLDFDGTDYIQGMARRHVEPSHIARGRRAVR
jgi:hypothetical protein